MMLNHEPVQTDGIISAPIYEETYNYSYFFKMNFPVAANCRSGGTLCLVCLRLAHAMHDRNQMDAVKWKTNRSTF